MNHPIQLNKQDHQAVINKIAEILSSQIQIDMDELVVISTSTVAQMTGLTSKRVTQLFPITEVSSQRRGVILKTIREYLKKNTHPPKA